MKKAITSIILFVLVITLAFGALACKKPVTPDDGNDIRTADPNAGSPTEETMIPLDLESIFERVQEAAGFGGMTPVLARDFSDIYGVDTTKVADALWYMSENPSMNADEFAIFRVSDPEYREALAEIFRTRIERQIQVAEAYSPEQAAKLKETEVIVSGSYVYFCVTENYDAVMEVLEPAVR